MVPQEGELVTATTTEGEEYAENAQMDRPHVFVINSDPSFLDLVRELLQEERYNVTTTNLVPRTFDQIAALRPSVLVVDLAFGQRAGWELLERLQDAAVTRRIPVMVVSTDARLLAEADAQRQRYGGGLFLAKPFDIEEMLGGVRLLTGEARGSAAFGGWMASRFRWTMLLLVLLAGTPAATAAQVEPAARDYWPTDGWREAAPETQGLDPAALDEADRLAAGELPDLSALLVVRGGDLVFERYYGGQEADEPVNSRSVTKSVTSALIGIALNDGLLKGLDQTLAELIPERLPAEADPRTADTTPAARTSSP